MFSWICSCSLKMSRSRLPVLHSSSELGSGTLLSAIHSSSSSPPAPMSTGLKRRAIDEDQNYPPKKLPAISEIGSQQPLRPSRTATNFTSSSSTTSSKSSLTIPKAPALSTTTRRMNRATSAPPKSSTITARLGPSNSRPLSNVAMGRTVSASYKPTDDRRFQDLQHQVSSIESARAADAARLAADMEAERARVSDLQENHLVLSRELAAAKSQELSQRREFMLVSNEIENIKKKHAREVMDLEMDLRKRDRRIRELEEDVHTCTDDLRRERDSNSNLKTTISEQSTAHVALNAQIGALQAQLFTSQAASDSNSSSASHYRLRLETAEKRVESLEQEVREAEMVRRRLHNMVQELKGNIRVFARVRPLLPTEISSTPSSGSVVTRSSTPDDSAHIAANMEFPDKYDHREITLSTLSESATGQERKETWQFAFDKVSNRLAAIMIA
jgi:kinesin family member C1